jgi:ankyrin repeat protein
MFIAVMNILYFQAKDKHGISALLAAIWEGHTDCVKLLLEQVGQQRPAGFTSRISFVHTHQ